MSHLQKRLSNCHCPCKKGFSDTNILFNMKHCMYLKILEVFRCKHCLWYDCMYAQTQTIVTVFCFHFTAFFFFHFMSVTITFTQPGVTQFQHWKNYGLQWNNNNFSSKYFMTISYCMKVHFPTELADMSIPWKSCHCLVNTSKFIK